jgi:hypothetical protein
MNQESRKAGSSYSSSSASFLFSCFPDSPLL